MTVKDRPAVDREEAVVEGGVVVDERNSREIVVVERGVVVEGGVVERLDEPVMEGEVVVVEGGAAEVERGMVDRGLVMHYSSAIQ